MTTLTLTDDEAVAIAATLGEPWHAPLPTVDVGSGDDLARAALRGRRSLVIRDLAEPDGTPLGAAGEVAKRMATGLRAMFLLADEAGRWFPQGVTVCLYGATVDAIEVSQVVAAAGVHYFRTEPPPGQWGALCDLAEAVYADGFSGAGEARDAGEAPGVHPPAAAFLQVGRPGGDRFIRVARGAVTTGRGPVPASFGSVADAIGWLLS